MKAGDVGELFGGLFGGSPQKPARVVCEKCGGFFADANEHRVKVRIRNRGNRIAIYCLGCWELVKVGFRVKRANP